MRARTVLIAAGIVLITAAGIQPATANPDTCVTGNVCLWGENSYTGCRLDRTGNVADYGSISWDNCAASPNNGPNSVTNRGSTCTVRYDGTFYSGAYIYFSNPFLSGGYQDPLLSNGGGYGPYNAQNWQDRVSSHRWCED